MATQLLGSALQAAKRMQPTAVILFVAGLVLLLWGAEWLVRGASRLAAAGGISPLVIGLTVVSFGTSAPELAVSIQAGLAGQADVTVGNVVGSNIANVLLILGLSALVAPLVVAQQLVRLDVPLMIGVSFLLLFLARDGLLSRYDGLLLFGGVVLYTAFSIYQSRKENEEVQTEYQRAFGAGRERSYRAILINVGLLVVGLGLLVVGARWLVDGAVAFARLLGLSELLVGLTVVAAGTSLPELATSVVASLRGERDIAVGNVVGSNIFNILLVLGLSGFVAPGGIPIASQAMQFDIPVMTAVAIACLPIFFTGYTIDRWEGALFLAYYVAYTAYLILSATGHAALPAFAAAMLGFVLPLTILTLVLVTVRAWRQRA
jgi:cation:H+ antiporter